MKEQNEYIDEEQSKTQVKKHMDYLQKIGERLITLSKDQLKKIELSDLLFDAVLLAQKITSNEAKRRQRQYIGKLMRNLTEQELQFILDYFDILDNKSKAQTQMLHFIEIWRDKLIADDKALDDFIAEHPSIDIQYFRTLIRNARKEKAQNKPPKAYREIFSQIKQSILEHNG